MTDLVETFIAQWQGREGGQERANYGLFLIQLCDVLGTARPNPAGHVDGNDFVFERAVAETSRDGSVSTKRIDLYKRGCFVLEAKQSRLTGGAKEVPGQQNLFAAEPDVRGRRGGARAWDVLMMNARRQAEDYVRLLPPGHPSPPFVIVCDVGHCFEIYANFRQDGRAYDQFPDRNSFRIYLEDLRDPAIRERLATIFDPVRVMSLDPTAQSARVTRDIAARLAAVSQSLEQQRDSAGRRLYPPEDVAAFLSRCLFTMFAEDVELLPQNGFKDLLQRCEADPSTFPHDVAQLWEAMDKGEYAFALRQKVRKFNGKFFKSRTALPLGREQIGELRQAASHNWREVEPAIFGTLLEAALDPAERKRLGAHYTPRAYVERLVHATVIEPLRADWDIAKSTAERQRAEALALGPHDPERDKRLKEARDTIAAYHARLCETRVLDPACGTGNFLYVALELMKRLEGEVLEALESLGGQEGAAFLGRATVDPHVFYGLELNPRAAAIAELVLWIGYLQWHFRTRTGAPPEPILQAFDNITRTDAVLKAERSLKRDANGKPEARDGEPLYQYNNPRRPEWPAAEFIVGNPPFIGGKDLRARLGDDYAQALWAANGLNESADFVMYWWHRAAELLTRKGTVLRRFGFVTTNSISQVFQRRVMEKHLDAKKPVSILMAIPDHPWTTATRDPAAVRIAMTVVAAGKHDGKLREVVAEAGLDTDQPSIELTERDGAINSDLTVGVDVTKAVALRSNEGICSPGVKLHGAGFIVAPQQAEFLGLGRRPGLDRHIRHYRNGRDLTARPRGVMVIDLFGLEIDEVRTRFPEVYQHLSASVKPERDVNNRASYRESWWIFGEPRRDLRPAVVALPRFIATVETAKHRIFQFLDASILPDNKLVAIGTSDAWHLGVLSSRQHATWALRAGGLLEDRPVYVKTTCFDPFPFPDADEARKQAIRLPAERIDALRKDVLARHRHLTLTGLYNVLERLRAGVAPTALEPEERRIFDDGLVGILREYHDELDAAVAAAYGWPVDADEDFILRQLVALNRQRAAEEARGEVRWLRPDYQIPRFATPAERAVQIEADLVAAAVVAQKPRFPADKISQTGLVMASLASAAGPVDAIVIAGQFQQGRKVEPAIASVLQSLARTGVIATFAGGTRFALNRPT